MKCKKCEKLKAEIKGLKYSLSMFAKIQTSKAVARANWAEQCAKSK